MSRHRSRVSVNEVSMCFSRCVLMPTCKDVFVLVSDAQDRYLTVREWLTLRLHLLICTACRNFAQQLTLLRHAARQHRDRLH
jgi:hypothetical protein